MLYSKNRGAISGGLRKSFKRLFVLALIPFFLAFYSLSCSKSNDKDIFDVEKKLKEIEDLKDYSHEDWERLNKLLQEAKIAQVRKFEIRARKILENLEEEIELSKIKLEKLKSEKKDLEKSGIQVQEQGTEIQGFQREETGITQEPLR